MSSCWKHSSKLESWYREAKGRGPLHYAKMADSESEGLEFEAPVSEWLRDLPRRELWP